MPRNVEDREPKITLAISKSGAQATEQTFGGTCVTGGRSPDNMLRVDDDYVSSRHFRFDWDGTAYGFRDLGSSNGSLVNGTRVREATLKEGDVITVGVTRLTVRKVHAPLPDPAFSLLRSIPPSLGTVELPKAGLGELGRTEPAPLQEESDPGLAPPLALPKAEQGIVEEMFFEKVINLIHGDLQALWKQHDVLAGRLDALAADQHSEEIEVAHTAIHNSLRSVEAAMRNLEKDQRRLKALHSTAVLMNRVTDLRGRLNAILDLAIEIMQADCGFLLLYEERTDKISVALNRGMGLLDTADSEQLCTILAQSPTPSMSIAREAMRTRQCMVVLDLRQGSQFDAAQSIMVQGILAALCAPMIFDNQLVGLIYVDFRDVRRLAGRTIGPGDRELFEALASLAATAIQNAKFFRNIKIEVERRSSLQRYLSPELVDQVIHHGRSVNLDAMRRHASVMFCDIRNFTPFAESTEPGQLIRQLNHYFSVMLKAIMAENGSLDKFLGDGLMAFFGPLIELEGSEIAAARAACQMQRSMAEINRTWAAQGWRTWEIGIGINAGEVVAGNLGSDERLEYTVIGDTVNVASRLSGAAKPGQILAGKTVAERLPPSQFTVIPLDPVQLKGKAEKVPVFEVRR